MDNNIQDYYAARNDGARASTSKRNRLNSSDLDGTPSKNLKMLNID